METTKKITLATVKSFINKNRSNLFIEVYSSFDGMSDMVEYDQNSSLAPAKIEEGNLSNTLGVAGAWFVGSSRDRFGAYNEKGFVGYRVSNCCGSFVLAVKESAPVKMEIVAEEVEVVSAPAVAAGEVQIVDYSEKAFAVIGDTKPVKEILKANGGKFNPHLKCGAGWIFSKKRLTEVQTALQAAA